jgi:hypothetical protein
MKFISIDIFFSWIRCKICFISSILFLFSLLQASSLPCLALSPSPGSTVLDACAAPGNKTIGLANYLENNGFVFYFN